MVIRFSNTLRLVFASVLILAAISFVKILSKLASSKNPRAASDLPLRSPGKSSRWQAPDTSLIPVSAQGNLIRYGRDLVANTSLYLGPKGKVAPVTNGMNCQNCHLDAGTRLWGNNFSAIFSTYPQFRGRSGTVEDVYKRVNDCIERSLNGKKIDITSREMQAFAAYINWVGSEVPKNVKPAGAGIRRIQLLSRPADPGRGQQVYQLKCQRCHGAEGGGLLNSDSTAYHYPPLWGENSYNTGAGIFRLSHFAGYIRDNMPFDKSLNGSLLMDEEAWDVAAFVNIQPRPKKKFRDDWPDISRKPFDYPFGPFTDTFTEHQHKFGPYGPMQQKAEKIP